MPIFSCIVSVPFICIVTYGGNSPVVAALCNNMCFAAAVCVLDTVCERLWYYAIE